MKFHHLRWMAAALTAILGLTVLLAAQAHPAQAQAVNCADTAATGIPQTECQALVAIYATGYPPAETGEQPCDWSGITCTAGRVTGVELTAQKAAQTVPNLSALTKLANLRLIPVTDFYFTGNFPLWIASSASIRTLDVSDNHFYGTMPSLSAMTALETLSLKNANLHNGLPALPPSLKSLDASANHFYGAIPASYGSLTNLVSLNLDSNMLFGEIPAGLAANPWVTLSLSWNGLSTANPELVTLLNLHDPDFFATQTIPPANVTVSTVSTVKATISWAPATPIAGEGGYSVCVGKTSGNYNQCIGGGNGIEVTNSEITGLTPSTTYYGAVRTYTAPHDLNDNSVYSSYSSEITFTTKPTVAAVDCADTATNGIPQAECEAVVGVTPSLMGYWEAGLTPCDWYSVSCSSGHVTRIESPGGQLMTTFPDLSALTHLETLWLFEYTLSGEFPSWIAASSRLKFVFVDNNGFSGPLPDLSAMTSLEQLGIGMNHFSGPLPDLSMLPNLTLFWAADNDFSGTIHSGITHSTCLEILNVAENDLSGPLPDLRSMTALKHFNAWANDLSGELPPVWPFPPNIEWIELSSNHLAGAIPASYAEVESYYYFSLSGNMLTGAFPSPSNIEAAYNALTAASLSPTDYFYYTQTLPPAGINVTHMQTDSVYLSWTPIIYTQDTGSYQIGLSTTSGSGYVFDESTADKTASQIVLHNLTPDTTYYGVIRTVTLPHELNPNTVTSLNSVEFSFTTPATSSLVNCADTTATGIPQAECEALIPLYATGYPSGEEGEQPCDWSTITCTNGHVTRVDISNQGRSGTVPNLSVLAQLEILDASNNSFTGSLPAWIRSSLTLKDVDLSWNQFDEYLYDNLSMPALERLSLSNNKFRGNLWIFASLPNLRWLDAGYTKVTFSTGTNLWPKLEYLSIEGNNQLGTIPAIANIPTLLTFRAGRNQFTGAIPALPTNIQTIDLSVNHLTGAIPPLPSNLQTINLSTNSLSGAIPSFPSGIQAINLSNNKLSGTIPTFPSSVQAIALSLNNLTGTIPSGLGSLPALRSLNLDGNAFSGAVPLSLTYIAQWDQLNLSYNALTASYPSLITLLNAKDPDFFATQTVPPTNITFSNVTLNQATVNWTPIAYTGNTGYYQVRVRADSGSEVLRSVSYKSSSSVALFNLTPNTTYDIAIRTVTSTHSQNPNTLTSPFSEEYSFTTPFVDCSNLIATGGIPKAECELLMAEIKPALRTIDYGKQPCAWSMIRCDGGHVVAVYDNPSLSAIPDLSGLRYLEEIEICCTDGRSFPAWIAASPTLRIVKLGANDLSGSLPDLSLMISLEELHISGNQFSGSLPDISALPNIRLLDLRGNNFSGTLPPSIAASTTLEFISVEGNALSGPLPDMSSMTALKTFSASWNEFSGPLPAFAPGIENIAFMWNRLTGEIPASYGDLPNLIYLALHSNALTGEIPANLRAEFPYFRYNGLTATDPDLIAMINQGDPEFFNTQTVPPTGITVGNVTPVSADLSWTPIVYTANGGAYEIGLSTTSSSGYLFNHATADKLATGISLSGLAPETTYYGVIRTVTPPWGPEIDPYGRPFMTSPNTITSLNSAEFTFTTGFDPDALNCANTAMTGIPQTECEALVAVFPDKTENVSPCTWGGITCTGGHVTALQFAGAGLTGSMPDLSALTHLESIEAFGNGLSGEFPAWIAASSTLKYVSLGENAFSGPLPDLSAMTSLEDMNLMHNSFSGTFPDISGLTSLQILRIYENQFTGPLPDISMLPSMRILWADSNNFTGTIHSGITASTSLEWLLLRDNDLSGPLPDMRSMTALELFNASENDLIGNLPSIPPFPPSITAIALSSNHFTGSIPASYTELPLLDFLVLDGNNLTGEVPAGFADVAWEVIPELNYNALTAADPDIAALLASADGDFFGTQTLPPTGIAASNVTPTSADLSWTPILYTADTGAYEIGISTASGGGYVFSHSTADKSAGGISLSGLAPQTTYYVVVRTVTHPHAFNPNTVTSLNSAEFSFTTAVDPVSAPVLLSPAANGTVRGTNSPVLSWMPNPAGQGVTAYQLLLKNAATGAKILKQTVPAALCAATCAVDLGSLAPQIDLALGVYNWQVTATGSLGAAKSIRQKFSVVKPDAPVITAPLGTVSDPQPDLTWTVNPDDLNTGYKLKLTGVKSGVVFKKTVGSVCSGAACAIGLDALAGGPYLLKNDTYTLLVKAINEIGGRKATITFKVKFPAPAVNLAPAGGVIVNTPHPVLSWTPDPNATSFQVILNRIKNGAVVKTFKVSNLVSGIPGFVCSAGTCTLDLAALESPLALPKGNYAWKVVSANLTLIPMNTTKSAKATFKIVLT